MRKTAKVKITKNTFKYTTKTTKQGKTPKSK